MHKHPGNIDLGLGNYSESITKWFSMNTIIEQATKWTFTAVYIKCTLNR